MATQCISFVVMSNTFVHANYGAFSIYVYAQKQNMMDGQHAESYLDLCADLKAMSL